MSYCMLQGVAKLKGEINQDYKDRTDDCLTGILYYSKQQGNKYVYLTVLQLTPMVQLSHVLSKNAKGKMWSQQMNGFYDTVFVLSSALFIRYKKLVA